MENKWVNKSNTFSMIFYYDRRWRSRSLGRSVANLTLEATWNDCQANNDEITVRRQTCTEKCRKYALFFLPEVQRMAVAIRRCPICGDSCCLSCPCLNTKDAPLRSPQEEQNELVQWCLPANFYYIWPCIVAHVAASNTHNSGIQL